MSSEFISVGHERQASHHTGERGTHHNTFPGLTHLEESGTATNLSGGLGIQSVASLVLRVAPTIRPHRKVVTEETHVVHAMHLKQEIAYLLLLLLFAFPITSFPSPLPVVQQGHTRHCWHKLA